MTQPIVLRQIGLHESLYEPLFNERSFLSSTYTFTYHLHSTLDSCSLAVLHILTVCVRDISPITIGRQAATVVRQAELLRR